MRPAAVLDPRLRSSRGSKLGPAESRHRSGFQFKPCPVVSPPSAVPALEGDV
jgi:hypothetical protein